MMDFDTFTKIPEECERFGQIKCCQKQLKVGQSAKYRPAQSGHSVPRYLGTTYFCKPISTYADRYWEKLF